MCLTASAGFTMPSIIPNATRTSAVIASDPTRTAHPRMKPDSIMLMHPSSAIKKFLSGELQVECVEWVLNGKCLVYPETFPATLNSS